MHVLEAVALQPVDEDEDAEQGRHRDQPPSKAQPSGDLGLAPKHQQLAAIVSLDHHR